MRATRYLMLVCVVLGLFCATTSSASAQPSLTLKPPLGPPGSAVTVSGAGFCGTCAGVVIQFNDVRLASGVAVDVDGRFTTTVHVPADAATGPAQIIASQHLANGNWISTVGLFTVTVGPLLGGAGDASTTNSSPAPVGPAPPGVSTLAAPSTSVVPVVATTVAVQAAPSAPAVPTVSASPRPTLSSGASTDTVLSSSIDMAEPTTTDESMVIKVHSHAGRVLAVWLGSLVAALIAGSAVWTRVRPHVRITGRRR